MLLTIFIWSFILAGAFSLLFVSRRIRGAGLLGAGYLLAVANGSIRWPAIVPIALLVAAGYGASPQRPRQWRIAGHVVFVVAAIGLALHLLPGFENLRVIGPIQLKADAVPFSMYLNLDKPLAGFWLLLVWPALCLQRGRWSWLRGLLIGVAAAVVCLGTALLIGRIRLDPGFPVRGWLWAPNNLLLVCLAEEALFRGYLQEGLARRFADHQAGETLAIIAAASLFGLAHFAGGWEYVLVAGLAGVGYGIAYRVGGLQASVLAHFGLNLIHFTLFTYPMLGPK